MSIRSLKKIKNSEVVVDWIDDRLSAGFQITPHFKSVRLVVPPKNTLSSRIPIEYEEIRYVSRFSCPDLKDRIDIQVEFLQTAKGDFRFPSSERVLRLVEHEMNQGKMKWDDLSDLCGVSVPRLVSIFSGRDEITPSLMRIIEFFFSGCPKIIDELWSSSNMKNWR